MSFFGKFGILLLETLKSGLHVTGLVILMMVLLEALNVSSSGRLMQKLHRYPFVQLIVACVLGVTPGCAGGFAVVSMFTHGMISFGALAGGMVATFGDEAFWLFAKSPRWGFILSGVLLALAVAVGLLIDLISMKRHFAIETHEFQIHDLTAAHGHDHDYGQEQEQEYSAGPAFKAKAGHFLKEHVWNHVIKQHFLTVFLWTFGVLLFLRILNQFVDPETLLQTHQWAKYLLLLLAVAVGFVPESGPHLIFVMMFLDGTLPFSILLANSIAQNGHAGLPLIAQSRRNFFLVKAITMGAGLAVGALALALGL